MNAMNRYESSLSTINKLQLVVQLGATNGNRCPAPKVTPVAVRALSVPGRKSPRACASHVAGKKQFASTNNLARFGSQMFMFRAKLSRVSGLKTDTGSALFTDRLILSSGVAPGCSYRLCRAFIAWTSTWNLCLLSGISRTSLSSTHWLSTTLVTLSISKSLLMLQLVR